MTPTTRARHQTDDPATIPTMYEARVYVTPPSVAKDRTIMLAVIGPKGGQSERGTVYLGAVDARRIASALLRAAEAHEDGRR